MSAAIHIESLTGRALHDRLDDLAALRIAVFRDWPYLYDGDLDYERRYLATYAEAPGSVIVAAIEVATGRVVGAATGLPMRHEPETLAGPMRRAGYDIDRLFYFGESVLLAPWRGTGIGVGFFNAREAHARALGRMSHACFCGVLRPDDHPRRPAGFVPLDGFWRRRGYEPVAGAVGEISWRDLGEDGETPKPMQFWARAL
ncbi:GNAT family N-acetyltransferase [Tistrella mobilis]|uniref:GNAT family N-acetyltransferase n=1 Tax=Tistrella mobilis TaxID=171437 RepID=UPI0026387C97|nr:GNAT family N-acetyltransferase [uncultured Tistrella sp.]